MKNKKDDVLESHRKNRKCTNPKCLNKKHTENTTRFVCWYCGCSLKEVNA
ncbi:hypothetical protein [Peribacillus simplex]